MCRRARNCPAVGSSGADLEEVGEVSQLLWNGAWNGPQQSASDRLGVSLVPQPVRRGGPQVQQNRCGFLSVALVQQRCSDIEPEPVVGVGWSPRCRHPRCDAQCLVGKTCDHRHFRVPHGDHGRSEGTPVRLPGPSPSMRTAAAHARRIASIITSGWLLRAAAAATPRLSQPHDDRCRRSE